jgi:very-short-patch-repair endonuclease
MSALEDRLVGQVKALRLPSPEREVVLIPGRKFRCDLVWREFGFVVEVDGGTFMAGRHSRGMGQASDCEKQNLLTLLGWRVLRVTTLHVRNGAAVRWIEQALEQRWEAP